MTSQPDSTVSPKQAYEWVKTGYWSFTQFNEWLDSVKEDAEQDGYSRGYSSGDSDGYEEASKSN